ncbi:hypothetical protein BC629DRAFT_1484720 [Irpex lacteus]|nr:hypothetical protein BC629DRAFT_1484720 [Irpex lacteus]
MHGRIRKVLYLSLLHLANSSQSIVKPELPPECHKYLEVFVRGELQANDDEACRAPNPGAFTIQKRERSVFVMVFADWQPAVPLNMYICQQSRDTVLISSSSFLARV